MGPRVLKGDVSSQFLPKSCGTRPLQEGTEVDKDSSVCGGGAVRILLEEAWAAGQAGWSGLKFFCESQKTPQRGLWAPRVFSWPHLRNMNCRPCF